MSFNYAAERNRFDAEWEKLRKEYASAGMSEECIELMYQYDLQQFNDDRTWARHTQEMPITENADDESGIAESPMVKRYFDRFTTEYDTYGSHSRYWWIQEIACEPVADFLTARSQLEIEMLTLYLFEGYTHLDIAKKIGKPRRSVTRYISTLVEEIRRLYLENLTKASFK